MLLTLEILVCRINKCNIHCILWLSYEGCSSETRSRRSQRIRPTADDSHVLVCMIQYRHATTSSAAGRARSNKRNRLYVNIRSIESVQTGSRCCWRSRTLTSQTTQSASYNHQGWAPASSAGVSSADTQRPSPFAPHCHHAPLASSSDIPHMGHTCHHVTSMRSGPSRIR
jgi:hypothetical protein